MERSRDDASAFEMIVHRHYEALLAYLARSVGTQSGVDLAQQVFLVAFESRERFKPTQPSARPWLFGIASNLLRRWYRGEGRRHRAYNRLGDGERSADEFTSEVDDRLSAAGRRDQIRAALGSLPKRDRDPFLLFALGQLTYSEISVALGIPVGTVRSRIHRAKQHLSGLLYSEALNAIDEETDRLG